MSLLERRLHLLLDARRYELVESEARRANVSVAAVIREAIDLRFDTSGDAEREAQTRRRAAAERLLARASGGEAAEDARSLKDQLDADLDRLAR